MITTTNARAIECREESPDGFVCTNPTGHDGDHVALDQFGDLYEQWSPIHDIDPTPEGGGMTATGVIVAMHPNTTREVADLVLSRLESAFPGVTFAVVAGCTSSVAFPCERHDDDGG